jgi:hypothetical protein
MFTLARYMLVSGIALCVPFAAYAQTKMDAGSGPTNGATSTTDAGSGPTKGAKPNSDTAAASNSDSSTENSAGVTPGPKSTGGAQPVTPAMPEKK